MDILEFIKQMQEMYGEDVITTADKLEKPPKTVVREMFQNAFKDKKNPMLVEYEEQTENLLALAELMSKEKDLMPQENFDLL